MLRCFLLRMATALTVLSKTPLHPESIWAGVLLNQQGRTNNREQTDK